MILGGKSWHFLLVLPKDGFINFKLRLDDSTRPHSDSQNICLRGNVVRSDDSIYVRKETAEKGQKKKILVSLSSDTKKPSNVFVSIYHLKCDMNKDKIRANLKRFNKTKLYVNWCVHFLLPFKLRWQLSSGPRCHQRSHFTQLAAWGSWVCHDTV